MSENATVGFDGGVTFWTLAGDVSRAPLLAELAEGGLEDFCPPPPTPAWCVREALASLARGRNHLVRPLSSRDGFTLVLERRGEEENQYLSDLSVRVEDSGELAFSPASSRPAGWDAEFGRLAALAPAESVGRALTRLVRHLGGVALRRTGGVYWLPADSMPRWRAAARALHRSSAGRSVIYTVKHRMDEGAARALKDAVTEEIGAEAERLYEEVTSCDLSPKALEARMERAREMAARVEAFEGHTRSTLDALRESLERLQTALVSGRFQEMAHQGV